MDAATIFWRPIGAAHTPASHPIDVISFNIDYWPLFDSNHRRAAPFHKGQQQQQ